MSKTSSWPGLLGRRNECDRLSGLLAAAKAGRSQVVVLRGEAGIGKTALLDFFVERATGCAVSRAAGVESEMGLPFAGLHQLCSPYLDRLGTLPAPQQEALSAAFGVRPGSTPDRFLAGLAVLGLFSQVAQERPLACVVDDAQWFDDESAQTLEFVARRLATAPVALVLAVRQPEVEPTYPGLPELLVRGLGMREAAALLDALVHGALDPRVRDRVVAESHGNPLMLLELSRGQSTAELAFAGASGPAAAPQLDRLEQGFLRRLQPLPRQSRRLLLTAAAEPVGDVPLLWRAAERLGVGSEALTAAEGAGVMELGDRVRFLHPLFRSAVYRSGTPAERREVHCALADATDADVDPDRRAWHRARAVVGLDEAVAADLERAAGRAFSRGGLAAAAAFLEKAAALTPDPARRTRRSLDAASAKVTAGAFEEAAGLLAIAEQGPIGEAERPRLELLRADISFAANRSDEALPLLLSAARRLERLDLRRARHTYAKALSAALFTGRLATGPGARQVAEAVREVPAQAEPSPGDALLEGLAVRFTDGYEPAATPSHRAVRALATAELTLDEELRLAWLAMATAASLWDDVCWDVLTRRHLDVARQAGAINALPLALHMRALVCLFTGDLPQATALVDEARFVAEVTGHQLLPYGEVGLVAVRGKAEQAEPLLEGCLDDALVRGEGLRVTTALWARAVLCNGLGRYREALAAAREAAEDPQQPGVNQWALAELVEAGARSGDTPAGEAGLEQLSAMADASGTDWALGIVASRRALLRTGATAEHLYRESIDRLARTRVRVELARARLLYGEWLRREGRRVDARCQLRTAHEGLTAMGVNAFAERARHELLATGETVRKRTVEMPAALTAQEAHIARLAAQGLTNPEIGAALYISPRTVEWHLRQVFTKLGITTRRHLRPSLPDPDQTAVRR